MIETNRFAKEYMEDVKFPEPLTDKQIATMDAEIKRIVEGDGMTDFDYNIQFIMDDLDYEIGKRFDDLEMDIRKAYQEPMAYAHKILEKKELREGKDKILKMFVCFIDFFGDKSKEYKFMATALINIVYFEGLSEGFNQKVQKAESYSRKAWLAINQIVYEGMFFDDLILIYTDMMCERYR